VAELSVKSDALEALVYTLKENMKESLHHADANQVPVWLIVDNLIYICQTKLAASQNEVSALKV
jgi:hypothetical protein